MVSLLEGIKGFFGAFETWIYNLTIGNKIEMLKAIRDLDALKVAYTAIPLPIRILPELVAVYNAHAAELEAQGMLTPGDLALGIFKPLPDALMSGFAGIKDTALTFITDVLNKPLAPHSPGLADAFNPAVETLMKWFFTAVEYGGVKVDEKLKSEIVDKIKPLFTLMITFEVGSWLAEWIQPMKNTGMRHIAHALYDTVGFKELSRAYTDPIRLNLVEQPIKYAMNELTTPFLPTQGEITGLARKYEITKAQFHEAMSKQGIGKEWRDALYSGFWADPRLFEILRLMEVELPPATPHEDAVTWLTHANMEKYIGPNWWLAMKFGKAGYDQIDIPVLIKVVRARNLMKELGDIRTLNRNIYKDGGYTRGQYEEQLAKRGISKEEAKELIDAIDKELAEEQNKVYRAAYEKKYLYGRITVDELKAALEKYGLKEKRIEARTQYLLTLKEGKLTVAEEEVKDLTRAEILKAYRVGEKEKGWALKRIDDQGYTTEDAVTLVNTEEKGLIEDVNAEWIRAYEQRTLNLRMKPAELEKEYIKLGKDAEWAKARAAYFEERVTGKEKVV